MKLTAHLIQKLRIGEIYANVPVHRLRVMLGATVTLRLSLEFLD